MKAVVNFNSELEAAQSFLAEVAHIMDSTRLDFVVVGGWIPYLFNSKPIPHPGTYDVDVLLEDKVGRSELQQTIDVFLSHGYISPVKNRFQLYRILTVQNKPLAFHVDFLHRKYADSEGALPLDFEVANSNCKISIATPGTDLIFTRNERVKKNLSQILPDGQSMSLDISFASEAGFLSAKGRSIQVEKRVRDAFDVYLIIKQSTNYEKLTKRSNALLNEGIFKLSMTKIFDSFKSGKSLDNTLRVLGILQKQEGIVPPSRAEICDDLNKYFKDIGWEAKGQII